jgi:hypothetical protein
VSRAERAAYDGCHRRREGAGMKWAPGQCRRERPRDPKESAL